MSFFETDEKGITFFTCPSTLTVMERDVLCYNIHQTPSIPMITKGKAGKWAFTSYCLEECFMTWINTLRSSFALTLATCLLTFNPIQALAESAYTPDDPAFEKAIEKVVEKYIITHPEVIELTLQGLQAKREAEKQDQIRTVIATKQDDLLNDPDSPVSGNPKGDVTVVEFFDYRCGYCKRVAAAVTQLQKDDPEVRIVYKDFPILGDASELAARAALAAGLQNKHLAFHEALLASKHEVNKNELLRIAKEVGLDIQRLEKDMAKPEWEAVIKKNRALASALGITGTPGFIAGTELVPGAVNLDGLKSLVSQARNASQP